MKMDTTTIKYPIRICMIIGKWVGGGVESIIMNYYRKIDRNKIQFDFLIDEDSKKEIIPIEEINTLGGNVIFIPPYQKIDKYIKTLKKIYKQNNYYIVHSNINALSILPLYAAKLSNVPIRIAHCHSTSNKKEITRNIIKDFLRPFSKVYANNFFACSETAGRWLFGNKFYSSGKVKIIEDAIDIEKYKFNQNVRDKVRKNIKIQSDTVVIGHVGRFCTQKNHDFLVDVFSEYHKKNKNSILMLIGAGPLEEKIRDKVKSLKIEDSVMFLGQRTDVNELYQAMDIFLFPSLYEGFGMALLEAQCSGLNCFGSDIIPDQVKITDKLNSISLSKKASEWANQMEKSINNKPRLNYYSIVKNDGYDINEVCKKLEEKYINLFEENINGKSITDGND